MQQPWMLNINWSSCEHETMMLLSVDSVASFAGERYFCFLSSLKHLKRILIAVQIHMHAFTHTHTHSRASISAYTKISFSQRACSCVCWIENSIFLYIRVYLNRMLWYIYIYIEYGVQRCHIVTHIILSHVLLLSFAVNANETRVRPNCVRWAWPQWLCIDAKDTLWSFERSYYFH